jgi:ligand-binding sensor domain-containing protein
VGTRWQIAHFNGSRFENVPLRLPPASTSSPSAGQYLHPVIQDRAGEWWVATGQGVYRFPRVKRYAELANMRPKSVYTTQHGLASNVADALFEDSRGDVWISAGSRAGQIRAVLCKWERKTGSLHTYAQEANGLPPLAAPVTFAEDARGNLWMVFGMLAC